ncbi:MAG: hypothetical protein Q9223_006274 [Gallowayella weberi]
MAASDVEEERPGDNATLYTGSPSIPRLKFRASGNDTAQKAQLFGALATVMRSSVLPASSVSPSRRPQGRRTASHYSSERLVQWFVGIDIEENDESMGSERSVNSHTKEHKAQNLRRCRTLSCNTNSIYSSTGFVEHGSLLQPNNYDGLTPRSSVRLGHFDSLSYLDTSTDERTIVKVTA